jgi:hypothetical protein
MIHEFPTRRTEPLATVVALDQAQLPKVQYRGWITVAQ